MFVASDRRLRIKEKRLEVERFCIDYAIQPTFDTVHFRSENNDPATRSTGYLELKIGWQSAFPQPSH